jgi:agmatinase|tara:strand:- start:6571 stop:7431 length:861 start_codon:yes stop_codon:yes gene_type:complete
MEIPHNFLGLPEEFSHWKGSKIVVLPVAYGGEPVWGAGAEKGPSAMIEASKNMDPYDEILKQNTAMNIIHTGHTIEGTKPEDVIRKVRDKVTLVAGAKKFPVILGGDHSITPGAVSALKEYYPDMSVLQLDAHADLWDKYKDSVNSPACVMTRIREMKLQAVQVGIRSLSEDEKELIEKHKYDVFYMAEMKKDKSWQEKALKGLGNDVYITLDLDVLDPSIMPATGTPEPGGMLWDEILEFLELVFKRRNVIGVDITELSPIKGMIAPDYLAAKLAYRIMGLKFRN